MDLSNLERLHKLLLADESIVARIEAFYRLSETEAAYTRACELRDHYDAEFSRIFEAIKAGRPARLTNELQQAQSQSAMRALNLLIQLGQVRALVARDCNHELGEASPYWNDQACRSERHASYEFLCNLRQWEPPEYVECAPRKRESAQQRTPTPPVTRDRNDLTRRNGGCAATNPSGAPRREGCEGREGHKQPMSAYWSNAERMSELANRVNKAYAELMRQARAHNATTSQASESTAPRPEPVEQPATEPEQIQPSSPITEADTPRRLTPLQQAALQAIGNWLLVIGHCRPTLRFSKGGSKPGSADLWSAMRPGASDEALAKSGRPRSYYAGPGGACPRAAA